MQKSTSQNEISVVTIECEKATFLVTPVCQPVKCSYLSLNLSVGIYEGCFIFDLASLTLEVTRFINLPYAQKWP